MRRVLKVLPLRTVLAALVAAGPMLVLPAAVSADDYNAEVVVTGYADCPGSGYYCDGSGKGFTVTDSSGTRSFTFPTGDSMTIPVHAGSVTVSAQNVECFTITNPGETVSISASGSAGVTIGWEDIYPCQYS